jgi:CO/xanthine dehydrogenase Mo-binding subunit
MNAPTRGRSSNLNRRALLRGGMAAGGALVVPFTWGAGARGETVDPFRPNAFVEIDADNNVRIFLPRSDMGQGVNTSIPMILAEELDLDLDQVRIEFAAPGKSDGISQVTGGSTTTMMTSRPLQEAGAKARAMLVQAAAELWKVEAAGCSTADCHVLHVSTNQKLPYGALVKAASKIPVPEKAVLKAPADYRIIGKPMGRLDAKAKADGSAKFGIDVVLPRMKVASVMGCPVIGGKLVSVDGAEAMKIQGVIKVVPLDKAVAVIADHTGAAKAGIAALKPQWDLGPTAGLNQKDIVATIEKASLTDGAVAHAKGDPDSAIKGAAKKLDAVYHMPHLAHAPMEPINCTALVTADHCEIWLGHQSPTAAQGAAAAASGLPADKVVVHNHIMGGGFGRKVEIDMIDQAVRIAKTVDYPVKLIWTREEDIQQDFYRPYYVDRLAAGLGPDGKPVGWTHRVTGASLMGRFAPAMLIAKNGVDIDAVEAAETPYGLPAQRIEYVRSETGVRTGFWRGVGTTHNVFVTESFIDECAHAAGADPVAYRMSMIEEPRLRAVLEMCAQKSQWTKSLPKGWGRGVSVQTAWKTMMAQVVEVEVSDTGALKVHRVVCVVDPGQIINPTTVLAQVQGGIMFGLTAALKGDITFANGRVQQTNFGDYQPLRITETPVIESYILETHEPSGGMGEAPTAGIGPALTNAIFNASGVRVRQLPVSKTKLVRAAEASKSA